MERGSLAFIMLCVSLHKETSVSSSILLYTHPFITMSENRNKPYKTKAWEITRQKVLKYDKGLCQKCLGNYMADATSPRKRTKAVLVHHHFHVTEYPQYKYQMFVTLPDGTKVRNLYSLCSACHEEVHADTHRNRYQKRVKQEENSFTTVERWD